MSDKMTNPIVTISWCGLDVKQLYPDWTDEQCLEALDSVAEELESGSIAYGWGNLESLLVLYGLR